ncbi:MAG: hypothetical protein Q8Q73_12845 [Stagnimonas sp.]|nr:hypothetical protein [Stagnimonas sp.]
MKDIALSFIQYSSWPLALLLCVLLLRKQLTSFADRVRLFRAGGVEVQLAEQLHNQGFTKSQLDAVQGLSANDVDIFLLVSFTDDKSFKYFTSTDPILFKKSLLSLQDAGLLVLTNPEDPGTNLLHNLTPVGRRFRGLLVNSAVGLLKGTA